VFVDVDLDDVQLARVVTRNLVEDRGDHLARAAPFGPVIDEHRLVGLQYVLLERCIGYVLDGHFCSCKSGKHSTEAAASGDSGRGAAGAADRIAAGGPPRSAAWSTWSGPEGSSHSHSPCVPGFRLAHPINPA